MKTIVKNPLPTCDICRGTAKYDAPTIGRGAWAYMCQPCYDANAHLSAPKVGFQFITEATPETDRAEEIALAIENGDIDLAVSLAGDGDLLDYL
jgi:hypothetical protein